MKFETKKLTMAAFYVALGVVFSYFYIPVATAKCYPIQHMINVLSAVTLGPVYSLMIAFSISFIRNIAAMGSLLAFPGSMMGALLAGILYSKTKKIHLAFLGEVFGTGVLGALISYPIAKILLGKEVAIFAFVIPFSISTIAGSVFAVFLIKTLGSSGFIRSFFNDNIGGN